MISSSENALLLLKKWMEESAPIVALLRVSTISLEARGFIRALIPDIVIFTDSAGEASKFDETSCKLLIPLAGSLFKYYADWKVSDTEIHPDLVERFVASFSSALEINFASGGWCIFFKGKQPL